MVIHFLDGGYAECSEIEVIGDQIYWDGYRYYPVYEVDWIEDDDGSDITMDYLGSIYGSTRKFTKYPQGYVKANSNIPTNAWFYTDDYQICRKLNDTTYEFVEFNSINDEMISSSGVVDVLDYKDDSGDWDSEALDIITTYYTDLSELRSSVADLDEEDQVVAECIFEQTSSFDDDSVKLSVGDAEQYLDDIVDGKIVI